MDLFELLQSCPFKNKQKQFDQVVNYIKSETNCLDDDVTNIKVKVAKFNAEYRQKWLQANRMTKRFVETHKQWLEGKLVFPYYDQELIKRGRPKKTFEESSERSKRRKTMDLRQKFSEKELAYATQMSLRASKQTDAALVVRDVAFSTPKRAQKYRKAFRKSNEFSDRQILPDAALSMMVEGKLTRHQYNVVRSNAKKSFRATHMCKRQNRIAFHTESLST